MVAVIAWLGVIAEPSYELTTLHLVPVAWVTWSLGLRWGAATLVLVGMGLLVGDTVVVQDGEAFFARRPSGAHIVGDVVWMVELVGVTLLVAALRSALRRERERAHTDPLTGLLNRRAFMETVELEQQRADRFGRPFSVVYLDLDGFKAVNDRFGHETGDEVLRAVARVFDGTLRGIDASARLGGDEFGIIAPGTTPAEVRFLMGRLSRAMASEMKRRDWDVTFSAGAVTAWNGTMTSGQLVRSADQLMYESKRSGKNEVRFQVVG